MCRNLSENTAENSGNTPPKLYRDSSPLAKVSRWNLSLYNTLDENLLHVKPSCYLDVVVYMLECVFS